MGILISGKVECTLKTENGWVYIGDVNPVEHGGTWVRVSEVGTEVYEFIKLQEWFDERIALATGEVCVTDDWIDQQAIENFGDVSLVGNPHEYVESVVSYYGIGEFDQSPNFYLVDGVSTEEDIRAFLEGEGITF